MEVAIFVGCDEVVISTLVGWSGEAASVVCTEVDMLAGWRTVD